MKVAVVYLTQTLNPKDNQYPETMPVKAAIQQAYHQHFQGHDVEHLDWDKLLVTTLAGTPVPVDAKLKDVNFSGGNTLLVVLKDDGGGGEALTAVLLDPTVARAKVKEQFALIAGAATARGWNVGRLEYPAALVEVMPDIGVAIEARNYDFVPPSFTLVDPQTEEALSINQIWSRVGRTPVAMLLDPHPVTGRPFFCVQGFWEYHEHPSHHNDPWFPLRTRFSLFSRLDVVDRLLRGGQLGQREGGR